MKASGRFRRVGLFSAQSRLTIPENDDGKIKTKLPAGVPIIAAKLDNLKDGLPAVVKAPSSSQNAESGKARSAS